MLGDHLTHKPSKTLFTLFWLVVGALFFLPGLGGVPLFDWDEANFAALAQEMTRTGDYLRPSLHYLPFTEKPPLFIWLQALAMEVIGIGEYAARLPNAICGMLTLPLLYRIGRQWQDHTLGMLWAGLYLAAFLPHLYFKSGIIDPVFNFFIFLGLYGLVLLHFRQNGFYTLSLLRSKWWYLIGAGIATGIAVLTKGPAALAILGLTVVAYWVCKARLRWFIKWWQGLLYLFITAITAGTWYGLEVAVNGPAFMTEFFERQVALFSTADAGHGGFPGYHVVVLLIGCFPASVFAIVGHKRQKDWNSHLRDWHAWMVILLWVVVILFSIVQSKIVHYSSMAYFPLTYLAAAYLHGWLQHKRSMPLGLRSLLWGLGLVLALASFALPLVASHPEWLQELPLDPLTTASLQATVHWPWYTFIPGVWLVLVLIGYSGYPGENPRKTRLTLLLVGMAIWIAGIISLFFPRIEQYSQHGAITLIEEEVEPGSYLYTYGFRSYLPFFYHPMEKSALFTPAYRAFREEKAQATTPDKPAYLMHSQYMRDFILYDTLDKPGYLLLRTPQLEDFLSAHPQMEQVAVRESYALVRRTD